MYLFYFIGSQLLFVLPLINSSDRIMIWSIDASLLFFALSLVFITLFRKLKKFHNYEFKVNRKFFGWFFFLFYITLLNYIYDVLAKVNISTEEPLTYVNWFCISVNNNIWYKMIAIIIFIKDLELH